MAPPEVAGDTAEVLWAFTRAGALIDSDGSATGIPLVDTLRRRGTPRLVGSRPRLVTVAWTSGDSTFASGRRDADRIDVASFDGSKWSASQTIIRARRVLPSAAIAMRAGVEFDPSVVVAVARDSTGQFIRVARRSGDGWSTADWRSPEFIYYAAALGATNRSVSLLMMTAMRGGGSGVYSLRGGWSRDTIAWIQPQLIDSLRGQFREFSAARLGVDSVIVVWYSHPSPDAPKAMMTALSIDAGRTWKLTTPLPLSSGMDGAQVVVDAQGGLHVVYRGAPEDEANVLNAPGMIMHSSWRSGAWTRPTAVSARISETAPAVGTAPGGRLMAIWAESIAVPGGSMPKSLASLWTAWCS